MAGIGESLTLRPDGDGRWLAHADPDHQSITGMFGGWTAGVLLGAVTRTAEGTAMPSAMTVNYVGAVPPGDDVVVTVEHLAAAARSTSGARTCVPRPRTPCSRLPSWR